jgi:uncharacterized protein with PQ loop repeat
MEYFGWAGTVLFILCYMPQIYSTKISKSVGGVSLLMWLVQWAAYSCCLVYSFSIMAKPLIFGYSMGWLLTAWWLELYRQYKSKVEVSQRGARVEPEMKHDPLEGHQWTYQRMSGKYEEYSCPHGIGHSEKGIHGCDGCCSHPSFKKKLREVKKSRKKRG